MVTRAVGAMGPNETCTGIEEATYAQTMATEHGANWINIQTLVGARGAQGPLSTTHFILV